MEFGIPTLIEHESMEEAAKMAAELGFDFVEMNMNLPWVCKAMTNAEIGRLRSLYNVNFTIHADENLFFCDFNDRVSKAHLDTMIEAVAFAKTNKIPLINFHMSQGVYFTLPDEKIFLFERYENEYQKKLRDFALQCSEAADGQVALCIENTGLNHPFVHRAIEALLQYSSFRLTWDIGHDYTAGNCDTPFLMKHIDCIQHMHLHDSRGKSCHLPLGKGESNPDKYLKIAHPERVVIEVKSILGLRESIPWLKSRKYIK